MELKVRKPKNGGNQMAHIIKVDGTKAEINDTELATLQGAVGGLIQIVNTPDGKLMVMDEEGKLKGKQVNETATALYNNPYDVVVGDVVICEMDELE
jgi:hypothetical protein